MKKCFIIIKADNLRKVLLILLEALKYLLSNQMTNKVLIA